MHLKSAKKGIHFLNGIPALKLLPSFDMAPLARSIRHSKRFSSASPRLLRSFSCIASRSCEASSRFSEQRAITTLLESLNPPTHQLSQGAKSNHLATSKDFDSGLALQFRSRLHHFLNFGRRYGGFSHLSATSAPRREVFKGF